MSFEFLHSLGQPTMDMVQKFSPYLWWVGVIWSLIVFSRLARLAERLLRHGRPRCSNCAAADERRACCAGPGATAKNPSPWATCAARCLKSATSRIAIAVALIIWYFVANWILDAGKRVSFEFLHSLGQPTMDMVQKFSPYLWWVGVGIWSLIVFFALRAWLSASLASGRATPVQTEVLAELAPQLSDESLGVLRWTWGDREEPFTVGDLRRSLSEIRHSRIAKIDMVARQAEILEGGGKPAPAPATTTPAPRTARRPPSSRASAPPISDFRATARSRRPGGFQCAASKPLLYWPATLAQPRAARHTDTMRRRPAAATARPPGVRFPCSVLPSGSPPAWRWPARPPFRSARRRGLPGPTSPSPSSPRSPPAAQ